MEQKVLQYKNSKVAYLRFGTGIRPVICIHGYDEQAIKYDFLERFAGTRFSFYAFDLPFHGESEWKDGSRFTSSDLTAVIQLFIETELPSSAWQPAVSILAFSLGGRVALSLYEQLPSQFDSMVLLAPDGLKVNGWYWFATQTKIGNRIFDFCMSHPGVVLWLLKFSGWLGIINASVMKFCRYYLRDKKMSRLLYQRWTGLSDLRPNLNVIRSLITSHKTNVTLVYGKHDRIIKPGNGERFCKGLGPGCNLKMLDAGHMLFNERKMPEILDCFTGE